MWGGVNTFDCVWGGGVQVTVPNCTIKTYCSELKGCRKKDEIDWKSAKFDLLGTQPEDSILID